jgi:hypothetical protein
VGHIEGKPGQTKDYSAVINKALEMPGFAWEPKEEEVKTVMTGFARNAVLGVAGEVVKAVQEGHLKHIFLVGGCDGHGEQEGVQRYGGGSMVCCGSCPASAAAAAAADSALPAAARTSTTQQPVLILLA